MLVPHPLLTAHGQGQFDRRSECDVSLAVNQTQRQKRSDSSVAQNFYSVLKLQRVQAALYSALGTGTFQGESGAARQLSPLSFNANQ
jgi:hypothetical protein